MGAREAWSPQPLSVGLVAARARPRQPLHGQRFGSCGSRGGWDGNPAWASLFHELTAPFRTAHPGVDIVVEAPTPGSNDFAVQAAILAGKGPDVFSGFGPSKMIEGGLTLDLTPYLKEYGVDIAIFDRGQVGKYMPPQGGVYAVPAELSTTAVLVNVGLLNRLGIPRPSPVWGWTEAEAVWRKASGATAQGPRIGFSFWGHLGPKASIPGEYLWRGWGASYAEHPYAARCGLDSGAAQRMAEWLYPLLYAGVVRWGSGWSRSFPSERIVCSTAGSWTLPSLATSLRGMEWDFWPSPAWPQGVTSFAGNDYYAVNAHTRHPQESAAFSLWLTTSDAWQRELVRLQLVIPPARHLWSTWAAHVQAVAPVFRGKNVAAFTHAALLGRAFNRPAFRYNSVGAYGLIAQQAALIASRRLSPSRGLASAVQVVNAFERTEGARAGAGRGPG